MAKFKPDPDLTSIDDLFEALSMELASRYRDAEDFLIHEVAARAIRDLELANQLPTAPARGGLTVAERRRQNRILAELAAHRAQSLRELQATAVALVQRLRVADMAGTVIRTAVEQGEAAAAAQLGFASAPPRTAVGIPVIGGNTATTASTLAGTAAQAVAMVGLSLESSLEILNQRLTRYPRDAYQQIVSLYSPNTLLGVTTSRVQQAQTVQRFLAEGIPAFVDRAGRRWTIGAYAEMAGRTTVNRAFNDAAVWRMQQSGINLITIAGSPDACKKCAPWIGRILSTDGTPPGPATVDHLTTGEPVTVDVYGSLDQARAAGWGHPNDRCKCVAYSPGLSVPQAGFQYDEAADKDRAEQRRLEREIRSAKRAEASAMNDVDRRRAAADVRAAQADMRAFIEQTGRKRASYREQLHFADGNPSR